MSILGEMFGYDSQGNDILGVNENPDYNCAACGVACSAHTREMEVACLQKLYAKPRKAEE
jgi:hypothetical protein